MSSYKGCILILARKGSKGIKNKNMVDVCGQPLIHYVLSATEKTGIPVYVSSDCSEILDFSKNYNAIPILRPSNIAQDLSPDIDSFAHFFKNYEKYDYAIHLRATFPMITKDIIMSAHNVFLKNYNECDSLRSMIKTSVNPFKMWQIDGKFAKNVVSDSIYHSMPRQMIQQVYAQNACVDIVKKETIVNKHCMVGDKCIPFIMEKEYNIDIDTKKDLEEAINALRI